MANEYGIKKSRRLQYLVDIDKDVSKDVAIDSMYEFVNNASRLTAEDLSPMAISKLKSAMCVNDSLVSLGMEDRISNENKFNVMEIIDNFDESLYPYVEEKYVDKINKTKFNAYKNEFEIDEWYLKGQMDEEEGANISKFTDEGYDRGIDKFKNISIGGKKKKIGLGFGLLPKEAYEESEEESEEKKKEDEIYRKYTEALKEGSEDAFKSSGKNIKECYDLNDYE